MAKFFKIPPGLTANQVKRGFKEATDEALAGNLKAGNFNISIDGVIPKAANQLNKFLPLNIPLISPADLPTGVSALGLPVFDSLRFSPGKYTNPATGVELTYPGLLINTVVFELNQQKNIVKTPVHGRSRTVKEYISAGDIAINITGIITNEVFKNSYPAGDVAIFKSIMQAPKPIKARAKILSLFDIKFITVESWRLIQTPGKRNAQSFTIQAVSDIQFNDLTGQNI